MKERLKEFGLTKKEVLKSKVNPYKAQILKSLLLLIVSGVVLVGNRLIEPNTEIATIISSIAMSYGSFQVGDSIINYIKYNKLKNYLIEERNEKSTNNGRGL